MTSVTRATATATILHLTIKVPVSTSKCAGTWSASVGGFCATGPDKSSALGALRGRVELSLLSGELGSVERAAVVGRDLHLLVNRADGVRACYIEPLDDHNEARPIYRRPAWTCDDSRARDRFEADVDTARALLRPPTLADSDASLVHAVGVEPVDGEDHATLAQRVGLRAAEHRRVAERPEVADAAAVFDLGPEGAAFARLVGIRVHDQVALRAAADAALASTVVSMWSGNVRNLTAMIGGVDVCDTVARAAELLADPEATIVSKGWAQNGPVQRAIDAECARITKDVEEDARDERDHEWRSIIDKIRKAWKAVRQIAGEALDSADEVCDSLEDALDAEP